MFRVSARRLATYANQAKLPRLPVADLGKACAMYLGSVKPLLTPSEFAKTSAAVEEFRAKDAGPLLSKLQARAESSKPNWLEEWWDVGAYLSYTEPLPFKSNYYFKLADLPSSSLAADAQTGRAAGLVSGMLAFKAELDDEALPPSMAKSTPLCMSQFARLFSHVRIPALGHDRLVNFSAQPAGLPTRHFATEFVAATPRHITVLCNAHFWTLQVLRDDNTPYSVAQIERGLRTIKEQARRVPAPPHAVGWLTAADRLLWASQYAALQEHNHDTLHAINSSLFVVCLDEGGEGWGESDVSTNLFVGKANNMANRFYDKHQLVVMGDGRAGLNLEHAPGDGTTALAMTESAYAFERALGSAEWKANDDAAPLAVSQLEWKLPETVVSAIEKARTAHTAAANNARVRVVRVEGWGARGIKGGKMAPDAFAQMAKQLAFRRQFGLPTGTYESGSTRGFLHGRTETIRSLSEESHAFTSAMDVPAIVTSRKSELQLALLRQACAKHTATTRQASMAQGCDRLFLGLKYIANEAGLPLPALYSDVAYSLGSTWRLSTSNCGSPALTVFGFGPVVDDGYGCGYFIEEDSLVWNITTSSGAMDAGDFGEQLEGSVAAMRDLVHWEAAQGNPQP